MWLKRYLGIKRAREERDRLRREAERKRARLEQELRIKQVQIIIQKFYSWSKYAKRQFFNFG